MSDLGNKEVLAENLNRLLEAEGLNAKDFSGRINVPYTTVLDWINAKTYPRIDRIEIMANYFGIEKSDLIEKRAQRQVIHAQSPARKYLMDKLSKATEEDIEKMSKIWEAIKSEESDW